MSEEVWTLIAAERRRLAAFLEGLEPADWVVPSLCSGWTVRDVAAHLAWQPVQPPGSALAGLIRSGFRVNQANRANARRWSQRPTTEITGQLRAIADDRHHLPTAAPVDELIEVVCHGYDIARPVSRPRPVATEALIRCLDRLCNLPRPLGVVYRKQPRALASGLRLSASDVDWSFGKGAQVHGSGESLVLALAGRPVAFDEFTGPGASTLMTRVGV